MAFSVAVIIHAPFVRSIVLDVRKGGVQILAGVFIVPFVIITYADIRLEARVKVEFLVKLAEENECLVILSA